MIFPYLRKCVERAAIEIEAVVCGSEVQIGLDVRVGTKHELPKQGGVPVPRRELKSHDCI